MVRMKFKMSCSTLVDQGVVSRCVLGTLECLRGAAEGAGSLDLSVSIDRSIDEMYTAFGGGGAVRGAGGCGEEGD